MIVTLLIVTLLSDFASPEIPASWEAGIHACNVETGEVLIDINGSLPFRPASTVKAVTTLSALENLGPEFVYHTSILADTTSSTLILKGSGAPLLSAEDVTRTALEAAAFLPERSSWNLFVDVDAIAGDSHLPGWDEDDWDRTYCPPVEPLCIGDNVVEIIVWAENGSVQVATYPPLPSLQLFSSGLTVGSTTSVTAKGGNWETGIPEVTLSGTVRNGDRVIMYKPFAGAPEELCRFLQAELEENGLTVNYQGIFRGEYSDNTYETASVMYSDPLWMILGSMNKWSRNLVAEQVLRTVAGHITGEPGSTRAGCDISGALLDSIAFHETGWQLADGSGLSRLNLLTPRQLTEVFLQGASSLEYGPEFLASFPVNGVDGTLAGRMSLIPQGSFRGKTGSLNDTCSIAGILRTCSGKTVALTIFLHIPRGHIWRARAWQDKLIEELYRTL